MTEEVKKLIGKAEHVDIILPNQGRSILNSTGCL
jgi:hypothetical protein